MKITRFLSRILTGLIFVFSGFVKALDPIGSSIKFSEYFEAFHMGILIHMALPLAILLSAVEFMIGLNLLAGLRMKFTAWVLILFMSFFTVLTFILALSNPISDCGCFGDALKLTNWQTFLKNTVLLIPAVIVFLNRNRLSSSGQSSREWLMISGNFLLSCSLSFYCIWHQPILDFRPYTEGTYIPGKMIIPEGAETDVYETRLLYEKEGRQQEFSDQDFPWQDTTWKWVETRQKLIKKGFEPPIHDFSITTDHGADITNQILADSGYTFLIIAPDLDKTSKKGMEKLNSLALKCRELGFAVYGLTSSTNHQISAFVQIFQPAFDFCTTDETTLKTIIRANPGVMLLHHGTILGKWNFRDAPAAKEINYDMLSIALLRHQQFTDKLMIIALILAIALLYSLVYRLKF
jgi:uncharacterized membrane protein YphA (DoxX/SURF4 family)